MSSASAETARLARLIARGALKGALATNRRAARPDAKHGFGAQPYVSKVGVATDLSGAPLFLFSTLAAHTQDLLADPRAALLLEAPTTTANPLEGARCTLVGRVEQLVGVESDAARALYLTRHPGASLYAGFGDFSLWRLHIEKVHYVGGFGRAKWAKSGEYLCAADGLADAQARIVAALNGAKRNDLQAVFAHHTGRSGRGQTVLGLDADGLIVVGGKGVQTRIDFSSPARDVRGWQARFRSLVKKTRA
ncbi:heme iron utilization protein [Magnetovibrio sp.]|uniref:HugZ family pyridoxamine 5'-phosphate oxidase n=1 Tax=Magnetovibrio sp. TaxID=2024836 RepID=UPI002F942BDF